MKTTKPSEKEVLEYILTHSSEDFPMDQTMEEFYEKVKKWIRENDKKKD